MANKTKIIEIFISLNRRPRTRYTSWNKKAFLDPEDNEHKIGF